MSLVLPSHPLILTRHTCKIVKHLQIFVFHVFAHLRGIFINSPLLPFPLACSFINFYENAFIKSRKLSSFWTQWIKFINSPLLPFPLARYSLKGLHIAKIKTYIFQPPLKESECNESYCHTKLHVQGVHCSLKIVFFPNSLQPIPCM